MEYGAIDLHARRSQIRIVREDGAAVLERRVDTSRDDLGRIFARAPMRILIESSTDSEWVAQHLETLGHEVIVADPNFTAMYGHRSRRIKTDRRDVAALAEACQRGGTCHREPKARSVVRFVVSGVEPLSGRQSGDRTETIGGHRGKSARR